LDSDTLRAKKPEIIYCNIGAFGAKGPLMDRPGYDPLMQAFVGLMNITGEPDQRPVRVGVSIIDMAAGMWCVIGVLSALYHRCKTRTGTLIDTSLFETALGWMCYHAAGFHGSGELPMRQGSGAAMIVPYRGYETKDGFIIIAAGNDKLFATLSEVLGHPEWSSNPRYLTNADRIKNQTVLYQDIEEIVRQLPNAEWIEILDAVGIPNAPIQSIADALVHPQTKALHILQKSPAGDIDLLGLPLSFDGVRPGFRRPPPELGQHTKEVLGPTISTLQQPKKISR
jgi:crotonobetainyl-CoA:carnitine CoA-transferase CaiB-like acyl-CoA transferase